MSYNIIRKFIRDGGRAYLDCRGWLLDMTFLPCKLSMEILRRVGIHTIRLGQQQVPRSKGFRASRVTCGCLFCRQAKKPALRTALYVPRGRPAVFFARPQKPSTAVRLPWCCLCWCSQNGLASLKGHKPSKKIRASPNSSASRPPSRTVSSSP